MKMKELLNLCLAIVFALLLISGPAAAHAIVTSTSMNNRPLPPNRAAEVVL
ncbi:MAG: copper resistance protein CopC, partial [Alphaproteobacteria bacterium]|nr:copper resistance protein CopC [Alphaproteobacteria bacterium]